MSPLDAGAPRRDSRRLRVLAIVVLISLTFTGSEGPNSAQANADEAEREAPETDRQAPRPFTATGRLVRLGKEMRRLYQAEVPPQSPELLGFHEDDPGKPGAIRYYVLLRTYQSQALFSDPRFREHRLKLSGRVFPGTALVEVSRFRWFEDGVLQDLHYWCEVCSIRGVDPGPCACCQGPVELRSVPTPPQKR